MRIYTKKGDNGKTALIAGKRVSKDDFAIEAVGTLDELNAFLGIVKQLTKSKKRQVLPLELIQSDLFIIGSCVAGKPLSKDVQKYFGSQLELIEQTIDAVESTNKPLKNFILPGGSPLASYLHYARTLCRRAERIMVTLLRKRAVLGKKAIVFVMYLNRLSDYFFVLARASNSKGRKDLVWISPKWF